MRIDRSQVKQLKSEWRAYERELSGTEDLFTVGLGASFVVESLCPFLGAKLLRAGFNPFLHVAPYNQLFQVCMDPFTCFGTDKIPEAVVLLWRIEDILAPELECMYAGRENALDKALKKLDEFASAVKKLRSSLDGVLIVNTPPSPQSVISDLSDLRNHITTGPFHRSVLDHWNVLLEGIGGVDVLDLDALQRAFGADDAFDARKWYLYNQPYAEKFLAEIGDALSRIVCVKKVPQRKCAALDCDGTLWGGVVGEDGPGGLSLGDEFPGRAYRDLQRLLLHWHDQGVFLALLSKNNEAEVWNVFESHDAMVLRREHICSWRINWQMKSENILGIAKDLNIGLDSFVLIDDSAFEIEQMRMSHPEVTCLQLPEDPARIIETVVDAHPFDRLKVTKEDRSRTKMVSQERQRMEFKSQMSEEQFLDSLKLHVEAFPVTSEYLGRVTQLINKTNQFNLTTLRRTREQVQALGDDYRMYAAKVWDRFGEYGLTGLAIVHIDGHEWLLDTFLLSCRVLGRKVETALLAYVAKQAKDEAAELICGRYISTPKNVPVADFLSQHGFKQGKNTWWCTRPESIPEVPKHITLV